MPQQIFDASPATLQQIAQSLLELRRMARSIESGVEAFIPLVKDADTNAAFCDAAIEVAKIGNVLQTTYNKIAREALNSNGSSPGGSTH